MTKITITLSFFLFSLCSFSMQEVDIRTPGQVAETKSDSNEDQGGLKRKRPNVEPSDFESLNDQDDYKPFNEKDKEDYENLKEMFTRLLKIEQSCIACSFPLDRCACYAVIEFMEIEVPCILCDLPPKKCECNL